MADLTAFPDLEIVLQDLLADLGTPGTSTPDDLAEQLPFIRVERFGGADDFFTDTGTISIDVFAATRAQVQAVAEAVRQRLITGPHVVGAATIDKATTLTAPNEVPWSDSQTIRRFTATYRVSARRPRST